MTWTLALSNLATIPADERPTCKTCGVKFTPYQQSRGVYCCDHCKQIGLKESKREKARFTKCRIKPLEECKPKHQHNVARAQYFREMLCT
jgi:predicted RNA-binding protein YlxR (DUF448 family)